LSKSTDAYWAKLAAQAEAELLLRVPENKIRPRLEPTRRAVELLGDPQHSYRVIHVTGTNGKTSTTRFIERILREMGLRTGRFTSPHLLKINERLCVNGEPISDQVLYELWEDTKPVLEIVDAELAAAGEDPLTYFEALAALGFAVFADAPVDVLVLEVGMGGAWDSTNVADGDVAVFTPVGLDHTDRLGNTLEEIAETKSGIIKPNSIVVSAFQHSSVSGVLKEVAASTADAWAQLGTEFEILSSEQELYGQRFSIRGLAGEYRDLYLPLLGEYQVENAALAIAAVEAFIGGGNQRIMDDVLRVALADASSPGRLQVISREPLIVLDAAHNPQGAQVLAGALQTSFITNQFIGVLAVLGEKDAVGILRALEPVLTEVVITKTSSPRAIEIEVLEDLAIEVFGEHRVRTAHNVAQAMELAKEMLGEGVGQAIIAAGSVSLVADILAQQQTEDLLLDGDDDWDEDDADGEGNPDSRDLDYEDDFEDEAEEAEDDEDEQ
jgi:dihydrofolate synthase/folylpolyglutamate synthase